MALPRTTLHLLQVQAIAQSNELNFMVSAQEPEPDPITAEVKTVHLQATSTSSSFNPALGVTNYDVSLGPPGTNLTLLVSCAPGAVDCRYRLLYPSYLGPLSLGQSCQLSPPTPPIQSSKSHVLTSL